MLWMGMPEDMWRTESHRPIAALRASYGPSEGFRLPHDDIANNLSPLFSCDLVDALEPGHIEERIGRSGYLQLKVIRLDLAVG